MLNVCVAGASGWVGRSLVPAILGTEDLHLSGAVSRSLAGRSLREALGFDSDLVVRATVGEALSGASVRRFYKRECCPAERPHGN